MSPITVMIDKDVAYIDNLLLVNGLLQVLPAAELRKIPYDDLRLWCHKNAVYGLPSVELIEFLRREIGDTKNAIEVGGGNGVFGRSLGIISTDSKIQLAPEMQALYAGMGAPIVNYGTDVIELEASNAIRDLKPRVVFGSWVTQYIAPTRTNVTTGGSIYGLKETEFIRHIDKYIIYGNHATHHDKEIFTVPGLRVTEHHNINTFFSRAVDHSRNTVWVIEHQS